MAGDLTLTSGYTSPIHGRIGDNPGVGAINICYQGESSYGVDGNTFHIHAEAPLYFNPGFSYNYTTGHYNGLVLHVDLQRLQDTAAAIGGMGLSGRRFVPDLQRPQVLSMTENRQATLLITMPVAIWRRCRSTTSSIASWRWPSAPNSMAVRERGSPGS